MKDNFNDKIEQAIVQQSGLDRGMKSRHLFIDRKSVV